MVRFVGCVATLALVVECGGAGERAPRDVLYGPGSSSAAGSSNADGSSRVGGSNAEAGKPRDAGGHGGVSGAGGQGAAAAAPGNETANRGGERDAGGRAETSTTGGGPNSAVIDSGTAGWQDGRSGTGGRPETAGNSAFDAGTPVTDTRSCASLPSVTDYGAPGPFPDAKMFSGVGPNANYALFRPDATLGQNGFLHPIAAWGNGISTTPDMYQKTLPLIASHGFVIIACNDTQAEEPCLSAGLDWLIQQNSSAGPMKGKLDTTNEVAIGYSWGGGASIDTSVRPNVKATVSLHGMPPRQDPWSQAHAPLLLFTSTGDNFVTPSEYVTPNYQASTVQTFYATLNDSTAGHLYVVDEGAGICIGSLLASTFGDCANDELEHAPTIAWLRLWACGDANAKRFFYGDGCVLCQSPWTNPQRKEWQ